MSTASFILNTLLIYWFFYPNFPLLLAIFVCALFKYLGIHLIYYLVNI